MDNIDFNPMALLSLDTNGSILPINQNTNKRPLESSTSEHILIKRRVQKSLPSKFILNKNVFFFKLFY